VTGAGGFIGHHLVTYLKSKDYWVRGVDLKYPEVAPTDADEFLRLHLRIAENCRRATEGVEEVYALAADMGGMGFIHAAECPIMHNSALINIHMTHAAAELGVPRYFFSSSVCVYRDMQPGEPEMTEDKAIPAHPDNQYGWERLYSERLAMAYGRRYGMQVRSARFQNCYGLEGTRCDGREKAPAAICRKIAEATHGGTIEVWGDGAAVRSYTYIDDMVDGIYRLMQSDLEGPVNIGSPQYVTVDELAVTVAAVAGKHIKIRHVDSPVGVQSRNFSNRRIYSIGWRPKFFLKDGIQRTYPCIEAQVTATSAPGACPFRAPLREPLHPLSL
jgi:nucleoside-diphosphate-sugar epimerase